MTDSTFTPDSNVNETLRASLDSNVATRIAYETNKSAHDCAAKFANYFDFDFESKSCARSDSFFDAAQRCNVASFDFLNDAKRSNARFNVYAAQKVVKALRAIASNVTSVLDVYSHAMLLSLAKHRENDSFVLTRQHIYAMFSRACRYESVRVSDFARTLRVAESTATTQCSSSLRALSALNVLRFDEETKRVSDIDYSHAIFALLDK